MLACIWGGDRYAWGSAPILALIAATVLLGGALVARERARGRPDRAVRRCCARGPWRSPAARCSWRPRRCSRSPCSCRCSCRRRPARARPRPGCCWSRRCSASRSRRRSPGRSIARTGRYKRFPLAGLALMTAALALLAVARRRRRRSSRPAIGARRLRPRLRDGRPGADLAVQNSVDRRELGVATATTGFFRALGGAVGAALLGAVFAARVGPARPPRSPTPSRSSSSRAPARRRRPGRRARPARGPTARARPGDPRPAHPSGEE